MCQKTPGCSQDYIFSMQAGYSCPSPAVGLVQNFCALEFSTSQMQIVSLSLQGVQLCPVISSISGIKWTKKSQQCSFPPASWRVNSIPTWCGMFWRAELQKGNISKLQGGKFVIFPNLVLSGPEKPVGATGFKAFWDQTLRAAPESPKSRSIWDQRENNFGGVPYVTQ